MSRDVLIVDDQAFCIDRLTDMVLRRAPDARPRVAGSLDAAIAMLAGLAAPLVIVELSLPGLGREAGIRRLRSLTDGDILVLDARHDPAAARACSAAGADGYVTRDSTPELVDAAMAVVLAGGRYFPEPEGAPAPGRGQALTPRQLEVLDALVQGHTNLEIARQMGIALPTVKLHVRAILKALGARNRTEAAMMSRSIGSSRP